ncbi:hypothetical protein JOD52_002573 [Brachybacterium muris]|uniref:hypothetical protein n=1 Tax=Brachybacterium muris TaxID=219301 RepID=UPI001957B004|nr:hypothetical protein [Brachybacterium muris]MBM7501733.1 hypothetical protein [Brachybacterium muris]
MTPWLTPTPQGWAEPQPDPCERGSTHRIIGWAEYSPRWGPLIEGSGATSLP